MGRQATLRHFFPESQVFVVGRDVAHAGRASGGIATIVAPRYPVQAHTCREFFVGVVLATARGGHVAVANVYLPPSSSPFAPVGGCTGYTGVLDEVQEWVHSAQVQYGTLEEILWVGDFNARVGHERIATLPDSGGNRRGARLYERMTNWGYSLRPWSSPSPLGTYRHPSGRYSVVDYVWAKTPLPPQNPPPVQLSTAHWAIHPLPSPHALLRTAVTGPCHLACPAAPATSAPRPIRVELTTEQRQDWRERNWEGLADNACHLAAQGEPVAQMQAVVEAHLLTELRYCCHDPTLAVQRPPRTRPPNPNAVSKVRRVWYDATCRTAKIQLQTVRRRWGRASVATRQAQLAYAATLRTARRRHVATLEGMRLTNAKEFWAMLRTHPAPVRIASTQLHAHYRTLLE